MLSLLFRNRWFAVAWLGTTLVSASIFVTGGSVQAIKDSVRKMQAQRKEAERPVVAPPVVIHIPKPAEPAAPIGFEALPGSSADPAQPKVGDVFVDPKTVQRVRAVRRSDYGSSSDKTEYKP